MEKIFNYIGKIATLITIIGSCTAIYFAFHEKQIKLDIQTTYAENITTYKPIQNISVKYYYQDSLEVNNLWKMQWTIRNTGDKTIIGSGNNSQLLSNSLPLNFNNNIKILSLEITNSNNNANLQNENIFFQQWRRDEYIEITAFIESQEQPRIQINDRYIIDSEISYSEYSPNSINDNNSLIKNIPTWLYKTLRIIYFILAGCACLTCIFSIFDQKNNFSIKIGLFFFLLFLLIPLLWII